MPKQRRVYTNIAVSLVWLCSSSLAAQENTVAVDQVAPLPVITLAEDDNGEAISEPVRFLLTVDAQCAISNEEDYVVLAIADQTFSNALQNIADEPVEIAVPAEQLSGLQVDTLCRRRIGVDSDATRWLLADAFGVQATLVCTSGDRPNHVTAATAVDVTVDCAKADADVPTKTPASGPTPNQQPAD